MDKGKINVAVFVDLKKAFDTVDHGILLNKLQYVGFYENEYDWIQSYLSSRSQQCFINGVLSSAQTIKCGVSQGSILGSLLSCFLSMTFQAVSLTQHRICMQTILALHREMKILMY